MHLHTKNCSISRALWNDVYCPGSESMIRPVINPIFSHKVRFVSKSDDSVNFSMIVFLFLSEFFWDTLLSRLIHHAQFVLLSL